MYNQPETILEQYDMEIRQITKGRGAYICDTSRGMKLLIPFRGSAERAMFLKNLLGTLRESGYDVEQVCLTREGNAVAEDESGMRYWLKDMVMGSECSPGRRTDMEGAVLELARLHGALSRCGCEILEFMQSEPGETGKRCGRHCRELVRMKNYVQTRKSRNEFERCFQKTFPHFFLQAQQALELLEHTETGMAEQELCHGDLNQHNVLKTSSGFRIVHFENVCCQSQVWDLANFIRKMMEKNGWDTELGKSLLESYDREKSLSEQERKLLYSALLFPEKFWKITNHYRNSHKAWVSQRDIEKLNQLVETEPKRERFLENLFSFL